MKQRRNVARLATASLLAGPISLAMATSAYASGPISNPISAQIGGGWLINSDARDATGSTGIHAGLSVGLPNKCLLSPLSGKPSVDVDYNHTTGHGNHIDTWGLTYTERVSLTPSVSTPVGSTPRPYVGLGIGVYRNEARTSVTTTTTTQGISGQPGTTTTTTTSDSKSNTQIGGKVLAGVDFGQAFVEASYQISGSTLGVRTDTVNLAVGTHF